MGSSEAVSALRSTSPGSGTEQQITGAVGLNDIGDGGTDISSSTDRAARPSRPRILCIDDDRNVGATVEAILSEEGYDVSCLLEISDDAMHRAIDELEPDCILLDSASATSYHQSWDAASWIRHRVRSIPVIMFSAHSQDSREAQANLTDRSREAGFAAVLSKPFTLDELIAAVAIAVGRSRPFDHNARADARRDVSLAPSTCA